MSLVHPAHFEGNTVSGFYNGWCLPAPVNSNKVDDFMKAIASGANNILRKMLSGGETLDSAGDLLIGQMDTFSKAMEEVQSTPEFAIGKEINSTDYLDAIGARLGEPGHTVLSLWFLNISCLLKLQRIKNDNENGFIKMVYMNTKKK
jgi:hypothetical protein